MTVGWAILPVLFSRVPAQLTFTCTNPEVTSIHVVLEQLGEAPVLVCPPWDPYLQDRPVIALTSSLHRLEPSNLSCHFLTRVLFSFCVSLWACTA